MRMQAGLADIVTNCRFAGSGCKLHCATRPLQNKSPSGMTEGILGRQQTTGVNVGKEPIERICW
jgi:hypothetical protein